jgi:EAL domain-containing protein (putative c-di-GMP-specific phosphodiesterase class I)
MRLKVIAEGVEEESDANLLRSLQCDQMQGFLISKPPCLVRHLALLLARPSLSAAS